MTTTAPEVRLRTVSPVLMRAWTSAWDPSDRAVQSRLGWIWGLLVLNVATYTKTGDNLIPLPSSFGKVLTQGALGIALVLVLTINKRLLVRPNLFLLLITALAAVSTLMSVRGYFGIGTLVRCVRLVVFVGVLWLTTPWWGRLDLQLCRYYRRALLVLLTTVVIGMAISPSRAFSSSGGGRLGGVLWPIAWTQVAHYAAVFTGLTVVMWLAGSWRSKWTGLAIGFGVAILILTHTRTAVVALLAGILVGGVSLFLTRKRVRRAFLLAVVVTVLGAITLAPFLSTWFARGESAQELHNLSGRTTVWTAVVSAPRTEVNTLFGYGISNDSFNGLPIDSSWLSTYLDEGVVGDVIDGLVLLVLLVRAVLSPPGMGRALALFLIVFCTISSFIETGLGQPSPYFLELAVAMSLLMPPVTLQSRLPLDQQARLLTPIEARAWA